MSSMPAARAARLPVLALLLGNLGAEQWLMAKLQRHLVMDPSGIIHASVPMPSILSDVRLRLQSLRLLSQGWWPFAAKKIEVCFSWPHSTAA